MGFRFRKRVKLFPGITLNWGRSGSSVSISKPGATINVGPRGTHGTVGIPGTGVSYREKTSGPAAPGGGLIPGMGALLIRAFIALFVWMVVYAIFDS